jgi:sugar lactone lactonase YvrE
MKTTNPSHQRPLPRARFNILLTIATAGLLLSGLPAASRADILYVTIGLPDSIQKITSNGSNTVFTTSNLSGPQGIAFDSSGNLYVANAGNHVIEKFTQGGAGSFFADTGAGTTPTGLTFDGSGNLFVSTFNFDTIQKFTAGGTGSLFATTAVSSGPTGLAFDRAGNLFVSYEGPNSIEEFTTGGSGSSFAASSLGVSPFGLAFDSQTNLYVANAARNTIYKFTPGGAGSLFASTGLNYPTGIAFDSAGNLYAANSGDRTIEKFTTNGVPSVFASGLPGIPQFLAFTTDAGQPLPLLTLQRPYLKGKQTGFDMTITITGNISGTAYTVLTTSVLGVNANWTAIATNVTADATGSAVCVDTDSVSIFSSRFYRALVQ